MRDGEHSDPAGGAETLVDREQGRAWRGQLADDGAGPRPNASPGQWAALASGSKVGRYVIGARLGAGAMGVVYSALDPELDRRVAIKLLRPRPGLSGSGEAKRMLAEARAMARLSHPNVITVHDVGTHQERVFIAMEEIQGQTLTAWLQTPRARAQILDVLVGAGRGLAAAHDHGLVHGDFKPDNIMIGVDGRVLVMDFGLARSTEQPPAPSVGSGDVSDVSDVSDALTQTGAAAGTPAYMAPEQFMGSRANAVTDQFALCVTAYEAVYGERPFPGSTPAALVVAVMGGEIHVPVRQPRVPGWLQRAILKGLSREPWRRHADVATVVQQLAGRKRPARHMPWLLAVGAGVVALAVTRGSGERPRPCDAVQRAMDGVWDAPRRAAVQAALGRTRKPVGVDTVERVTARLDAYAQQWVAMRRQSCEATHVHQTQTPAVGDLRDACLDRRRSAVRAVVSVLERADDGVVTHAVAAVAGLQSLAPCADVPGLQTGLAAPADPEAVARTRERLDQVRSLALAGRFEAGVTLADSLRDEVAALGYAPVQAELALERGSVLARAGHLRVAETVLSQAYFVAVRSEHDAVASGAASRLAYVVGYSQARHQEGLRWGGHALASARRLAHGGLAEAEARHNIAVIADATDDDATAAEHYERAYALRVELLAPDHPDLGRSLNALGNLHLRRAQYDEALIDYRASMELRERIFGGNHPDVAGSLNNIALVLLRRRDYVGAIAALRRAIEIYTSALGPEHVAVAQSVNNLGTALRAAGDPAAAAVEHRRALAIREAAQGLHHPDVADPLVGLGRALSAQGQHVQARAYHLRALALSEQGFGPSHRAVGAALLGLGVAALESGQTERARTVLERARAIFEKTPSATEYVETVALLRELGTAP